MCTSYSGEAFKKLFSGKGRFIAIPRRGQDFHLGIVTAPYMFVESWLDSALYFCPETEIHDGFYKAGDIFVVEVPDNVRVLVGKNPFGGTAFKTDELIVVEIIKLDEVSRELLEKIKEKASAFNMYLRDNFDSEFQRSQKGLITYRIDDPL